MLLWIQGKLSSKSQLLWKRKKKLLRQIGRLRVANAQVAPIMVGLSNKAKEADDGTMGLATPANYSSVDAMRARLTAIDAAYYTTARLDAMTTNDMMYAIKVNDDSGTF